MSKWLLSLALTGGLVAGCAQVPGSGAPQPGASVPALQLTDIAKGADSQISQSRRVAVKDDAAWQALWQEHAGSDKVRPTVDFTKEMVLGAFAGEHLTAGYVVTIQNMQPRDNQILVNVREASPGPGGVTAQVLTTPFHLVRVPRQDKEIVFIEAPGVPTTP
jgi:hypothetical protein